MKTTIIRKAGEGNPDDTAIIGQWMVDKLRFRRSLKTLATISERDYLHHAADQVMLQTLGVMTLTWAIMERALDDIVGLVFTADASQAVQSTLPVTLNSKLAYLRDARAKLAWLEPFVPQMRSLQSRIKRARTHRKNVTHGVLEVPEDNRYIWRAKVLDFELENSTERTVTYEAKTLHATIREIDAIALDLHAMLGDLRAAFDAAQ